MTTLRLATAAGLVAGIAFWVAKIPVAKAQQQGERVLLSIEVTGSKGHYINGLQPKDFRILDDGIVQKLNTFAEGNKPPVQVLEDGNTRPLSIEAGQKQVEAFESIRQLQSRESLENSYYVTYYPAQNPNEGFRKISVEITSDLGKYRVRTKTGFRPRR